MGGTDSQTKEAQRNSRNSRILSFSLSLIHTCSNVLTPRLRITCFSPPQSLTCGVALHRMRNDWRCKDMGLGPHHSCLMTAAEGLLQGQNESLLRVPHVLSSMFTACKFSFPPRVPLRANMRIRNIYDNYHCNHKAS